MANSKTLRKRIVNVLRRIPDSTASVVSKEFDEDERSAVCAELNRMVKDGTVLSKIIKGNSRKLTVYRVPVYKLGDKEVSIREIERIMAKYPEPKPLKYKSIRERLLKGWTPLEILNIGRCEPWTLKDALDAYRNQDQHLPF